MFNEADTSPKTQMSPAAPDANASPDSTDELTMLRRRVAELEALTVAHAHAKEELSQWATQMAVINDIGGRIAAVLDLDRVLKRTAILVQKLFDYHHVALFLIENDVLCLKAVAGSYAGYFPQNHTQQLEAGINGWVASNGTKILANDISQESRYISLIAEHTITQAELCLPIKIAETTVGVLDIQSPTLNAFTANDVVAMETLTHQIAIAIENARLYETIQKELEDHKRTAKTVDRLRHQVEMLLNAAGEGIFGVDRDSKFVFVNPVAAEMLGCPVETLVGGDSYEFFTLISPDGRPADRRQCPIRATLRDKTIHRNEDAFFTRKDNQKFSVEFVSTPIFEDEEVVGAVVVFSDISGRKLMAEELRQAQKMEAVGRLAGGIAHDFNNILTVIIGHSDLLLHHYLPSYHPARQEIEEIKTAGERAAGLTRQLLAFSRQQPIQPQTLNLNEVVIRLEKMLRRLIGEDVELITNLEPALQSVEIDPGQIEQVIMNLAVNSRDAMPTGGLLMIETANVTLNGPHHHLKPGPYVKLTISDNGTGMDQTTMAQCFEPFFTTKELGKGTGLGLSTVYGIVRQSHGDILVSSIPHQLTTFTIYLPPIRANVSLATDSPAVSLTLPGTETILLVEDERGVRLIISRLLQKQGYHTLEASTAIEALEICQNYTGQIDLLITDIVLPEMNGVELTQNIKRVFPLIKQLFISGHPPETLRRYANVDFSKSFLQKPFTPNILIHKVQEILDRTQETDVLYRNL